MSITLCASSEATMRRSPSPSVLWRRSQRGSIGLLGRGLCSVFRVVESTGCSHEARSDQAVGPRISTACGLHQGHMEGTDREIDALVYELYGFTEEEIAIVEWRDH